MAKKMKMDLVDKLQCSISFLTLPLEKGVENMALGGVYGAQIGGTLGIGSFMGSLAFSGLNYHFNWVNLPEYFMPLMAASPFVGGIFVGMIGGYIYGFFDGIGDAIIYYKNKKEGKECGFL